MPGWLITDDTTPIARHFASTRVGEDIVFLDPFTHKVHVLNPTAALLWSLLDGEYSVGELVDDLAAEMGLAPAEIRSDVFEGIASLDRRDLIELDSTSVDLRHAIAAQARRAALNTIAPADDDSDEVGPQSPRYLEVPPHR